MSKFYTPSTTSAPHFCGIRLSTIGKSLIAILGLTFFFMNPAMAEDILAEAGTALQGGMTLVVQVMGAIVLLIVIYVVVSNLAAVARDRKNWGDVMGAVIGGAVVALVIGGLIVQAEEVVGTIGG